MVRIPVVCTQLAVAVAEFAMEPVAECNTKLVVVAVVCQRWPDSLETGSVGRHQRNNQRCSDRTAVAEQVEQVVVAASVVGIAAAAAGRERRRIESWSPADCLLVVRRDGMYFLAAAAAVVEVVVVAVWEEVGGWRPGRRTHWV